MLKNHKKEELFQLLLDRGIARYLLEEPIEEFDRYELRFKIRPYYFKFSPHGNPVGTNYRVESIPRTELPRAIGLNWQGAKNHFTEWADDICAEMRALDPWPFAVEASDDHFTRAELAEVQSQLRLLQLSFTQAALPEAAKQELIELTQAAAVRTEGFTKKEWKSWICAGFISAITGLVLNPAQAAEVLKLVKAAFGGLFLH